MSQYRVCQHLLNENFLAVKMGWSWPAFFFHGVWALKYNLHRPLLKLLITYSIITAAMYYFITYETAIKWTLQHYLFVTLGFSVLCSFVFGAEGNTWLLDNYCKRTDTLNLDRYQEMRMVNAEDEGGAISAYNQGPGIGSLIRNQRVKFEEQRKKAGLS